MRPLSLTFRFPFAFVIIVAIAVGYMYVLRALRPIKLPSLLLNQSSKLITRRNMHITSIPMWEGSHNNYAYLVVDDASKDATIVDPANPPEVLPVLQKELTDKGLTLKSIINTHHHGDHSGGNEELLKHYSVPILAGKDSPHVTSIPSDNSTFKFGQDITVRAIHTPCHTQDSICWFFEDASSGERVVFTGDTMFIGGCGRFFEGTPQEMVTALVDKLGSLPDDTKVYPGHEYTKGNVKFAVTVLPNSGPVQKLHAFAEANKETQGKFTIGDEKKHNVFMLLEDPAVEKATGVKGKTEVMGKLREMKNAM